MHETTAAVLGHLFRARDILTPFDAAEAMESDLFRTDGQLLFLSEEGRRVAERIRAELAPIARGSLHLALELPAEMHEEGAIALAAADALYLIVAAIDGALHGSLDDGEVMTRVLRLAAEAAEATSIRLRG